MLSMLALVSMLAVAPADTTVVPDTGPVLLTDTAVHTMLRLDTALTAVVRAHPDLQPVYQGLNNVNPYALAKAPLLVAVLERAGWTPMQLSRVHEALLTALEGIMSVALTGTRPGMTTIADRNINYLIDHQVEYGIQMGGGNLPPPSNSEAAVAAAPSRASSKQRSTSEVVHDSLLFQELTLTPDQGTLRRLLTGVAQRAQREHLVPIVDVGAPWCVPCRELDALMHDPSMQETMRGILVVHLNLDYWRAELDSLGINAASVPIMFAVDRRGTPIETRMQGIARDEVIQFISAARPGFAPSKTSGR